MMEVRASLLEDDETRFHITLPSLYTDLLKTIPGVSYKKSIWTMPRTYPGYIALLGTFKHELIIEDDLKAWLTEEYEKRIGPALAWRNVVASEGYPNLYPHQNADVQFLTTARRAILANGLGTGKTQSAFSTVRRLADMGENPFPVLVVAPNSTKISWKREIEKVWPGLTVSVVSGTAVQRRKQLKAPAHVYVMNWESLKSHSRLAPYGSVALKRCQECGGVDPATTPAKCHAHPKELNEIDFKTVIADEIHKAKDPSTQQSRALKAATGDAEFRFALTGTPIANSQDDLWSILNWLNPEAFPSKTKFIDRYLDVSVNIWGGINVIGIKKHMQEEFFNILDPILRRMPTDVVLPFLPPVIHERRDVEMAAKQKKAYEQMRDQMVAELDGGDLVITTSPLTKMTRMLQFASAYAELDEVEVTDENGEKKIEHKVRLSDPSAKLDAFMDDLEGFGDESVVVFSPSKQLINMLGKRLDRAKIPYGRITGDEDDIERQIHMDAFQDGQIQFILATTGAGGTGITLTRSSVAVYLGRPWSSIDSQQSEGRVRRIGSEIHETIRYIDYVTAGTVEEAVFDALDHKNDQLQVILRDKDLMRKVLTEGRIDSDQTAPAH